MAMASVERMSPTAPFLRFASRRDIDQRQRRGTVIEGDLPKGPVVVLRWNSLEALKAWKDSPDFVAAHEIGMKHAKFNIVAVNGVTQ